MTNDEKTKYALEELSRSIRYIDNFFWVLSSFWMAGTGFAISKALEWKGCNWRIIELSSIVIAAWILFHFFANYAYQLSKHFLKIANEHESYLGIVILPKIEIKKGMHFMRIMEIITILSIVVMIGFLIEYFG